MRNRNWLVIGLALSVAMNLALAGFVAGRMLQPGPMPGMLDPSLSLFRVVHDLPEPRRDQFRATLREHFHGLRGDLRRIRHAQHDINAALEAEPFDPRALDEALDRFRASLMEGQRNNQALLVKVATAMTAEERRQLIEAMSHANPHHLHGRPGAGERFPRNGREQ